MAKCTCKRCGWQWDSRVEKPKCCPGCKSSKWQTVSKFNTDKTDSEELDKN
jgi:predicted Zn-ribbon and HTH transcriptional regulator